MTTLLLPIGAPTVRYSPLSDCWLVDDGSTVPQRIEDRRTAYEVAATFVPPAVSPETVASTVRPGLQRFATDGVAGTDRPLNEEPAALLASLPPRSGQASGLAVPASPGHAGPDAISYSGPAGFVGTAGPDPRAVSP